MKDLARFLLDRIAEDEHAATAAAASSSERWEASSEVNVYETPGGAPIAVGPWGGSVGVPAFHMSRWDPARVLADCAAKRTVLERCVRAKDESCSFEDGWIVATEVVRLLAEPYRDHPEFPVAWRERVAW